MSPAKTEEKSNPFAALIGVSSLLAALLYLAGFAYRWSYYYNFGVQHLVFKLGVQSFLIASFEIIREPAGLARLLLWTAVPVLVLNVVLWGLRSLAARSPPVDAAMRGSGLRSALMVDLLRAAIIVYGTYTVASSEGYETFRAHVVDGVQNRLPRVTVVIDAGDKGTGALACNALADATDAARVIGDGARLKDLQRFYRTCDDTGKVSWRLLFRDDSELYVFAAESAAIAQPGARPLTLVLPSRSVASLILQ